MSINDVVPLSQILEGPEWAEVDAPLSFVVGRDISGEVVIENLARMPHLLISGITGSGKSVMMHTILYSLLRRNSSDDLKMIIIDPKQVEMAVYEDIPHLLTPIITNPERAISALRWVVSEIEKRYTLMLESRARHFQEYNDHLHKEYKLPRIVILIDGIENLMTTEGVIETLIVQIAQKGRIAGVHLVIATQCLDMKVITKSMRANIPGRIAFAMGSKAESRVMLNVTGAEKLCGHGDMLLLTTSMMGNPRRIQGAWANDDDVKHLTDFLREQRPPQYNDEVVAQTVQIKGMSDGGDIGGLGDLARRYDPNDPVVRKAIEITLKQGEFSTASLQTWLGKGYGFVSGLAIWLEEIGVIGPANGHKPREVLISSMKEFMARAEAEGSDTVVIKKRRKFF